MPPVPYFLAPSDRGPAGHPAVVVIMEGNGMSQQLLRVCQRFAHEGYTAIAPDLFHRFGGSDGDRAMAEGWYGEDRTSRRARRHTPQCISVRQDAGATSVGITGFCMGGMFTYLSATTTASTCRPPSASMVASPTSSVPRVPASAFLRGRDAYIPANEIEASRHHPDDSDRLRRRRARLHARRFASYHPQHAPVAWDRTLEFFAEHLT